MTGAKVSVCISGNEPGLAGEAAGAVFGLAMARVGGSVSDLERGEIALMELIESIEETTPIVEIVLVGVAETFELTLAFDLTAPEPDLDEGARQVIDAGLSVWTLGANAASITLSPNRPSS